MRRVPGGAIGAAASPVEVADLGAAISTGRPITARCSTRREGTIRLRPGENVVPIRVVTPPVDDVAFLGQCCLFVQVVFGAVKVSNAVGDLLTFHVVPGSFADAV